MYQYKTIYSCSIVIPLRNSTAPRIYNRAPSAANWPDTDSFPGFIVRPHCIIPNFLGIILSELAIGLTGANRTTQIRPRSRHKSIYRCTETILDMVPLHSISMWFKENGYRCYLRYATGSSFIGYLLDIGSVNPFPSHFYCPGCRKIQWASEHFDGFDLPGDHACSNDGTTSLCDGHKIRRHWLFREIRREPGLEEDPFTIKCVDILSTRIHFSVIAWKYCQLTVRFPE